MAGRCLMHGACCAGNHASIITGIKHGCAAGAKKSIYRHNDVEHLDELMDAAPSDAAKLVVFESVYSMSGTVSDIAATCDVAQKYGAGTFIDEVRQAERPREVPNAGRRLIHSAR
jgi:5-aminolevulinate synthase